MRLRAFSGRVQECNREKGGSAPSPFALLQILVFGVALSACQRPSTLISDPPAGEGSRATNLANTASGEVVLSYLEPVDASMELRYTVLAKGRWSEPKTVARGEDWFVSWADIPSVVPLTESLWAAHWRVASAADALSYNTAMSMSTDGGRSWQPAILLNTDTTPTEHGFVSVYALGEDVGAIWLDGRAYTAEGSPGQLEGVQLRAVTMKLTNSRGDEVVVDELVCDCCQTDAAISKDGPVIVYRDRSENEVRDIYFARHIDGKWNPGRAIASDGWKINGCPINGPVIDAAGEQLAIAWYTALPMPNVQIVFSEDGGASFGGPIKLSATQPLGRVDVVLLPGGSAAVSWLEQSNRLMFQHVSPGGEADSPKEVAAVDIGGSSGFPKMVYHDGKLIFSWTDISLPKSRVRTSAVLLE